MFSSTRARLLSALLLLILALGYWGLFGIPSSGESSPPDHPDRIDFFIVDADITLFNEQGQIARLLIADELEHYPARETTELLNPLLTLPGQGEREQSIRADSGVMLDDESRIDLAGNVQVTDNSPSALPTLMVTETLAFFPPRNYAETQAAVTIIQGQSRKDAIGMQSWFDEGITELLSEVRGYYVKE